MQNVSFQGRSNLLISQKTLDGLSDVCSQRHRNVVSENTGLVNGTPLALGLDNNEIIVLLKNERNGFISKFLSTTNLDEFLLKLQDNVNLLNRTAAGKLTAWILGGKPNDAKTIGVVNEIAGVICDRPDIDASILVGQLDGKASKVVIHGTTKHLDVVLPNAGGAKSVDEMENMFDIVELNNVNTCFDKSVARIINKHA